MTARFPLTALARKVGGQERMARLLGWPSVKVMAKHMNVDRMMHRGVNWARADEFAAACGFHPMEVWPDWLDCPPSLGGGPRGRRPLREPRWAELRRMVEA